MSETLRTTRAQNPATTTPGAGKRIEALDVLRGLAILGTLGTNVWIFTNVVGPPSAVIPPSPDTVGGVVEMVLRFLANGKALALLTLLFGVGLELQYRSARRRGVRWPGRYLWRAALLLAEGLLHYLLVFEWDVLMGYAVTSMLVAYLVGRSDRVVRAWMVGLGTLHVLFVGAVTVLPLLSPPRSDGTPWITASRPDLYSHGSYLEQVSDRIAGFGVYRAEAVLIMPMAVVLFLAGSRLLRAGAFDATAAGARIRRRLMVAGGIALPLNLATTFAPDGNWALVDRYVLPPFVALGVLGLVTTLLHRMRGGGNEVGVLRRGLTSVGRTALSCYVGQNLLCAILCYGWGFGLAERLSGLRPWWVPGVWAAVVGVLMLAATWWLRHFDRGPLETVWQWAYRAPFSRPFNRPGEARR